MGNNCKILFCYVLIACLYGQYGFAHDADKAFYKIIVKDTVIEVKAEFPWTIRKAFLREFPELSDLKNKQKFDLSFFEYIKKNFKIYNTENLLELVSVKKVLINGHSHQNNYVFVFKGVDFDLISNTLMCNLSKTHKNYHEFKRKETIKEYITTSSSSSFKVDEDAKVIQMDNTNLVSQIKNENSHQKEKDLIIRSNLLYYLLGLFTIILVSFMYYKRRNK